MKAGAKIKLDFAGKKKDGPVDKLFDKTVYLKVDFDKDKQKTVKRKLSQIDGGKPKKKYLLTEIGNWVIFLSQGKSFFRAIERQECFLKQ